jgi:DNA repair exonuclease SbcCD ATPase subunit
MQYALIAALLFASLILAHQYIKARNLLKRYQPITDIESEIEKNQRELQSLATQKNSFEISLTEYMRTRDEIAKEVHLLNEDHDLLSSGFYKPKYDFNDSDQYATRLDSIRDKQKDLIKSQRAIVCTTEWTVSGSRAEGKKMTDRIIKLGLSAFNVQCDNEILKVKFDNIDRAEEKLQKIRSNIDKLLEPNHCHITEEFFQLKTQELFLAYEYQEKLQAEKEEQRAIREQMRDEEKARREAEKAQLEAEKEERRYSEALEKARRDLEKKSDDDKESFLAKIADLEAKLNTAHQNRERAKSMAEMTRQGHVYIISNIGSFGENVYKIGMTRRLDPMDRVWELSDASVPFDFDVHAMIWSEDAPGLEAALHQQFAPRRLNKVNERKEFFNVDLREIEAAVKARAPGEFKLTLIAEAKEWRQSVAKASSENKAAA